MVDIANARDEFKFGTGRSPASIPHVTRLQETIQPVGPKSHTRDMKSSFNFRVSYNKKDLTCQFTHVFYCLCYYLLNLCLYRFKFV